MLIGVYNISFWNDDTLRYDQVQFDVPYNSTGIAELAALFKDFCAENGLSDDATISSIDCVEVYDDEEEGK